MKDKSGIAAMVFVVFSVLIILGFGIETITPMPPETIILHDSASGYYATPACVLNGATTVKYIKNRGHIRDPAATLIMEDSVNKFSLGAARRVAEPDPKCRDADGFTWRKGSILGDFLRDII